MFWAQNTLRRSSSTISLEWHNLSSRKRNQGKQEWQKPQNVTQQPGHGKTIAGCVICQNQNQHLCALHPPRRNTKVTRAKHKKYKFGPLNSESVPHKRKASLETPQRAEAAALCINPGEGTKPPALSFYRYLPLIACPPRAARPGRGCNSPTNTAAEQDMSVVPTYHRGLLSLPDLRVIV